MTDGRLENGLPKGRRGKVAEMVPTTELKLCTLPQCVSRTVTESAPISTLDS